MILCVIGHFGQALWHIPCARSSAHSARPRVTSRGTVAELVRLPQRRGEEARAQPGTVERNGS